MSSPSNSKGFTLIEVLIAIVVLSTGLVLIVQALGRTQQALKISQNLVEVSQLAEEKITALQLELFDKRKISTRHDEGKENFRGQKVNWSVDVGSYSGYGITDQTKLNQADVRLQWSDGPARSNTVLLSEILSNRPKKEEVNAPV